MSNFVESLKRLYATGKITDDKLSEFQTSRKITEEERIYIAAEQPSQPSNNDLQTFYDEVTAEVGI